MKWVLFVIGILMSIAFFSCDRGWRTPNTAFKDTVNILGRPNSELQMKDPANWVGTGGRRATPTVEENSEAPAELQSEDVVEMNETGIPDGTASQGMENDSMMQQNQESGDMARE